MAAARFSVLAMVSEQTERTKGSSISQIKQFIAELSDPKMASLETEIVFESESLKIEALSELRDRARATDSALRFLIAPIRTLPVELLAEIFVLTIREALHIHDAFRYFRVWSAAICSGQCDYDPVVDGCRLGVAHGAAHRGP